MSRRPNLEGGAPFKDTNGTWKAFVTLGYEDGKQIKKWVSATTQAQCQAKFERIKPLSGSLKPPSESDKNLTVESWFSDEMRRRELIKKPGTCE